MTATRRWTRPEVVLGVLIAMAFVANVLVAIIGANDIRAENDRQDQQADRIVLDGCARGNEGREADNQLNEASHALVSAVIANSAAVDTLTDAIIQAVRSSDSDGVLRPEVEEALGVLHDTVAAQTDVVEQRLAIALTKLNDALRDQLDCDRVLEEPNATIEVERPNTTIPTISLPGEG